MIYAYAKIDNNKVIEYPIYEGDLKFLVGYDDNSESEFICPDGYVAIEDVIYPNVEIGPNQTIIDDTPQIIDGKWTRVWKIRDYTEEELNASFDFHSKRMRDIRNQLLSETDWTQLPDSPVNSSDWADYRQQLRNIPEQEGFPWQVEWPNPPG
jgi:hypothetical protein